MVVGYDGSMNDRLIVAEGDAFARGKIVGGVCGAGIRRLLECQDFMNILDRSGSLREWLPKARATVPLIEKHAPTALAEMHGTAEGADLPFDDILLLVCAYDKSFLYWTEVEKAKKAAEADAAKQQGGCTSFAAFTPDGLICAENNDERPWEWDEATHDVVLHLIDEDGLETLTYTHPGIPAYMGMNSAGLVLMWMYIDNGDRAYALPSCVMTRETLTKRTLDEAVDYLRSIPHTMPNSFLLAHESDGICSVEAAPSAFGASYSKTFFTHANVIYEPPLFGNDETKRPELRQRDCRMAELVKARYPNITIDNAKSFITDSEDIDHEKGINNEWTLSSMVFHPRAGQMHIAIGMGLDRKFQTVSFRNSN
ncbi:hypothetical protein LCGC14_0124000 [marine sediment metagenome]|uniref:Peptidase C45 hydrolase domain-containing protein n=1 Tax=marine sediment metagenome TaxID=412755 RepID=A0A0F9XMJ8_9ZZZZ|nr:hypothetical protein [Phycisphaerae bacterium]HDZ42651.1 hypothetical protein [Phycisphaerae bacterium]